MSHNVPIVIQIYALVTLVAAIYHFVYKVFVCDCGSGSEIHHMHECGRCCGTEWLSLTLS